MAQYLKEKHYQGLTVNEELLRKLFAIVGQQRASIPAASGTGTTPGGIPHAVIRFDGNGFRVFTVEELLSYFQAARDVEHVVFVLDSTEALQSSRGIGSFVDVRLNARLGMKNSVLVASDDLNWTNSIFAALTSQLDGVRNRNDLAHGATAAFLIQTIGLFLGFVFSLWAAGKLAPSLAIEHSFIYSFLFILLVFSNSWSLIQNAVRSILALAFPNVRFISRSSSRFSWLWQALIGSAVIAIAAWFLKLLWDLFAGVLTQLIKTGS
jgi:hypothetical protein